MPGKMTAADVEAMRKLVDDILPQEFKEPEHIESMEQSKLAEKLLREQCGMYDNV